MKMPAIEVRLAYTKELSDSKVNEEIYRQVVTDTDQQSLEFACEYD